MSVRVQELDSKKLRIRNCIDNFHEINSIELQIGRLEYRNRLHHRTIARAIGCELSFVAGNVFSDPRACKAQMFKTFLRKFWLSPLPHRAQHLDKLYNIRRSSQDVPFWRGRGNHNLGKSKWGLSNGGLRPLSAICAQSSTIVHFCGLFGPNFKGNDKRSSQNDDNRRPSWTIVDKYLKPPFAKPPFKLSRTII